MSTSVLNSGGGNLDPQPTTSNMESSPGPSPSLSSPSSNTSNNVQSNTPTTGTGGSTMVGAPTSVVVTVSHNSPNSGNNPQQQIPSTSTGSSSSTGAVVASSSSPSSSSSQSSSSSTSLTHYENLLNLAQQQSSIIQMSSSTSTSGFGSNSSSTSSQSTAGQPIEQAANDLMKRTFDLIRQSDPENKYYSEHCKRFKTLSSMSTTGGGSQSLNDTATIRHKLEQRLNGILCCAVCLDLPKSSVYQCPNGHLMCAGCFTHVLADARLRDESPTCPNCRVSISKESCSRNLAVEKAVCELPGECRFCQRELPRSMLDKHMSDVCEERIVKCRFANIGCPWNGPFHEADYHAETCIHPNKSAREVLDHLEEQERKKREQRKVHETLFSLLSYEKICFHDVQFRPYRTDEYIHKLFYETSRFSGFGLQWVLKARVNDDQRDPTQSCDRRLSFQLCLKGKINNTMTIHYMLLKGPYGETKVLPMIYKFDFTETQTESTYNFINLATTSDSNRLLAARMINFRLIMFQASK